jgi:hypothetical protein
MIYIYISTVITKKVNIRMNNTLELIYYKIIHLVKMCVSIKFFFIRF